ncbi:MAG: hypothetical protein HOY76_23415, partial [Streptomyces sp.]|nr:hypothetical protein [Streptomyces sp.]
AKNLVKITVSGGDRDGMAGVLIATAEHPFRVIGSDAWTQASQVRLLIRGVVRPVRRPHPDALAGDRQADDDLWHVVALVFGLAVAA